MSPATKKKISKSLRKYHRCAARHKCGTKKKTKKTKKTKKHRKKKKKKGADLPAGYNIHTGKLDELFLDEN